MLGTGAERSQELHFGYFTLNIAQRTFAFRDRSVELRPKEFDLLAILVAMRGNVVSKSDLIKYAWSDAITDAAVFQAVYRLRQALAEYDPHTDYIATAPGRGYQFVATVVEQDVAPDLDVSGDAFAAYSRAVYQYHYRTDESLSAAIRLFGRAIRLDPEFALAYVGLAHAYLCQGIQLFSDAGQCRDRALEACHTALKIDAQCADAYAILSEVHAFFEADTDAAQQAIFKALALDPQSWRVRTAAFWAFLTANHIERAIQYVAEALSRDPSSNHWTTLLGVGLYHQRRYDEAHARLIDAHLFKPADAMALYYDACVLCCLGDYGGAAQRLGQRASLDHDVRVNALQVYVCARSGNEQEALQLFESLRLQTPRDDVALALAALGLGRRDEGAEHARIALASKQIGSYLIPLDPLYEPLR